MKKNKISASELRANAVNILADRKAAQARQNSETDNASLLHELQVHQIELEMQNDELQKVLYEKEILLKEIHHRVKNNMLVISSLLNMQARKIDDSAIRAMFEESGNRIKSMSLIHEKLYKSDDLSRIDFKGYLHSLIRDIRMMYQRNNVNLLIEMEDISLDVTAGIPCGLIFTELISNCLKHAFPDGRAGTIKLGVNKSGKGEFVLFVQDDGKGFPAGLDFLKADTLGLHIVDVLAQQLGGKFELSTKSGTRFSVTFPKTIL